MSETTICILGLVLLLALFVTGIELGFAMVLVGFSGFAYLNGFQAAIHLVGGDLFEAFTNYGYTVFPLFMLMGQIGLNAGLRRGFTIRRTNSSVISPGAGDGDGSRRGQLQGHLRFLHGDRGDLCQRRHSGDEALQL